jgi:hypothetical protein
MIGLNKTVEGLVKALIGQIKEKDQFFQSYKNSYQIDKNYFVHII